MNKNGFPLYIGLNLLIKFEVQPSNTHISDQNLAGIVSRVLTQWYAD